MGISFPLCRKTLHSQGFRDWGSQALKIDDRRLRNWGIRKENFTQNRYGRKWVKRIRGWALRGKMIEKFILK
jgi:hypothetical protein